MIISRHNLGFMSFAVITYCFFVIYLHAEDVKNPASHSTASAIEWVRASAIPINSDNPALGNTDLLPLKEYIGDARIVSLGEATHGTREIFRLKHRLVKFLVEEMGFTHFGIEASLPDCEAISDYVLNGEGEPEEMLFGQGFWTWDTEEVLGLIKWMRRHNEKSGGGKKVHFFGYDMQNPRKAAHKAVAYLEDVDPEEAEIYRLELNSLFADSLSNFWQVYEDYSDAQRDSLRQFAQSLIDRLDTLEREAIGGSDGRSWAEARLNAQIVSQCERMMRNEKRFQPSIGIMEWYRIYGSFAQSAEALERYLAEVSPVFVDPLVEFLETLREPDIFDRYDELETDAERRRWKDITRSIISNLEMNKSSYVSISGDSAYEEACNAARDISKAWQSLDEFAAMPDKRPNIRDASMGENISRVLDRAGSDVRMVLWAHNLHVTRKPEKAGYGSMGNELELMYGDEYYIIGFSFNRGAFQAAYMDVDEEGEYVQKLKPFVVGQAEEGTVDWLFAQVEKPLFFLDITAIPEANDVFDWFSVERRMRSIGAGYSYDNTERYFEPVILPDHFDAIIFIDSTTAARPNRRTIDRFDLKN